MCKSHNPRRIDPCMKPLIKWLRSHNYKTLACCCGHSRYPMTIVVKSNWENPIEILSGKFIPRKTRFYFKDKKGYYYIPEVSNEKNK